jgi:hypothetical protein
MTPNSLSSLFPQQMLPQTMIMSPSIAKFAPALLKAQSSMGNAVKDSKNPFFKSSYADLNSVREASHPQLNANDIMVLQPMIQKDGKNYVRTLLLHSSGEYIGSDTEITVAKINDPQAMGSAITYARRYGLQALVSLGAEDDDGNKAMGFKPGQKEYHDSKKTKETSEQTSPEVTTTTLVDTPKITKSSFRKALTEKVVPDEHIPKDIVVQTQTGWDN